MVPALAVRTLEQLMHTGLFSELASALVRTCGRDPLADALDPPPDAEPEGDVAVAEADLDAVADADLVAVAEDDFDAVGDGEAFFFIGA